jgi:hypothetical protein
MGRTVVDPLMTRFPAQAVGAARQKITANVTIRMPLFFMDILLLIKIG